jgi:hypothetical protein
MFHRLGLPSGWLHHLYQAVLAPVRMLWQHMPRTIYTQQYKALVEESTLHDNPTLANLAYVLWQAACPWVANSTFVAAAAASPSGCLLSSVTLGATAALLYFTTGSPTLVGCACVSRTTLEGNYGSRIEQGLQS